MAIVGFYLWSTQTQLKKGALLRQARRVGGSGGMPPPGKCWISDLLRSFLVQSGSNRDRYSSGILLNGTAETAQP